MARGDNAPRRVDGLEGAVSRAPLGAGSKSERNAIWLQTDTDRYVLRRKGGPSFGDRSLDKYLGKRVRCDGFLMDYMLLAERIEILR